MSNDHVLMLVVAVLTAGAIFGMFAWTIFYLLNYQEVKGDFEKLKTHHQLLHNIFLLAYTVAVCIWRVSLGVVPFFAGFLFIFIKNGWDSGVHCGKITSQKLK